MHRSIPLACVLLLGPLLASCDNIATWSKSAAKEGVGSRLEGEVRFRGLRYVRQPGDAVVCGRANGRRFAWWGDYQDGGEGEVRFYDEGERDAWRRQCSPEKTGAREGGTMMEARP